MKKFNELRKELVVEAEFDAFGIGNSAASIHTHDGVHRMDNSENLGKLNAFIENFLSGPTMNPKARLEQLKIRLNHVGLDFNCNEGVSEGEITSYEVKYYGEVSGYKLDDRYGPTGEIGTQDLATEKFGSPLVLSVSTAGEGNVTQEGRLHFVNEGGDDELVGEALELRLKIENDQELFESKFIPAFEDIQSKVINETLDVEKAINGVIYAVKASAKKYEMDLTPNEILSIAESFMEDIYNEDEEE
tara:strand:- start:573 stop:1310 length:738 start_codon:yes stop_codon:yes gene_type:complete